MVLQVLAGFVQDTSELAVLNDRVVLDLENVRRAVALFFGCQVLCSALPRLLVDYGV